MEEQRDPCKKEIDRLVDIQDSLDLNKKIVLTGNNGSGKSLLRKVIGNRVQRELNGKLKSISMEMRTSSNAAWGALSSAMHDNEWSATSQNTYSLLKGVINALKSDDSTKYLVLDEYEIGCSEETTLALTNYLNQELKDVEIGCLIITHSKIVVENLIYDDFINIQEQTKEEWLNRKIIPTDLDKLDKNDLFFALRDRLKEKES